MTVEAAADAAQNPGLIPRVSIPEAVDLIGVGLSRGDRVMALSGDDTLAAIDAVVAALTSDRVRVVPIDNPGRGPFSLARLVAGIAATAEDSPGKPSFERACDILGERVGSEERLLLVIDDADTLEAGALSFLGVGLSAFGADSPLLQILLVGQSRLWSVLERPGSFALAERLKLRVSVAPLGAAWPDSAPPIQPVPLPATGRLRADPEPPRRGTEIERMPAPPGDVAFPFVPAAPSRSRRALAAGAGLVAVIALALLVVAVFYRDMPWANWAAGPSVATAPPPPPSRPTPDAASGGPAPPLADAPRPDAAPPSRSVGLKSDFDAYVEAHQPKAAALPGKSRDALFQQFLAWGREHPEASPPPAADSALATAAPTALAGKRVVIEYPAGSDAASLDAARVAALIAPRAGWVETHAVRHVPRGATIRYLYADDQEAAAVLASTLRGTGIDWTIRHDDPSFKHRLGPDTLEVLLPPHR